MIWKRKNNRDGITYWYVRYDKPAHLGGRKKEKVPAAPDGSRATRKDAEDFLIRRDREEQSA